MRKRDVYGRSADFYDALYEPLVDYDGDVDYLLKAFAKHGKGKPKRVLDVGAGTCNHALRLAKRGVGVDAVDISESLLAVAARKVEASGLGERVKLHRMDMTRDLPKGRFDGAISMFGAWCYARTDEEASRLLSVLHARLPKGGLFAFEFWSPLGWAPVQSWAEADLPDGRRLVRLTRPSMELREDVYEFETEHIVMRDGELVENFSEGHGLRLRTPYQTQALLARNGFEVAAFTRGAREGKSFEKPAPNEFRVMCLARRT
ncbi:MAG TPA: class I SAM-dependent methyltransferase [Candidatus Thermoplasmatota archaeon]|nr:class I SAM-dependent methyltransferase [Candidatus Thermoplasmatota archaeon]